MRRASSSTGRGAGAAAAGLYVFFVVMSLLQRAGETTYDTRAELTQRPGDFLAGAFTLWHPESNFGEFQNQAYGYLFPQGTWFWLTDVVGMADWVSQRLWTALVLIVACEGARRVAVALGLNPAAALVAGLGYGFAPRMLGTIPVITGEALPGAVMPWVVLPLVLALERRIGARRAIVLSAAAVVCMGGVNAVENAGSLPLALLLVGWGVRRGALTWRLGLGWVALVGLACLWWALPLLVLAGYAPPFYAYVESASDTTALVGWSEAVRGDSHWVAYLTTGDQDWWPAARSLATTPWLMVIAAVIAGIGLTGLLRWRHPLRGPLLGALVLGLAVITIAHGTWAGTPVAGPVRSVLDGPLQIFRNVHKIDPTVRLPLAIGFGHAAFLAVRALVARRPRWAGEQASLYVLPGLLLLALAQPYVVDHSRTPGWESIAKPWQQAKHYLAEHDDGRATLVVPGSGFAIETWGWTLDEPLMILGGTKMAARSQVPIIPGQSIRYLDALDKLIATGRAPGDLSALLARAGIGHVVVRRDLDRSLTGSPPPGQASVSLAHGGLVSVASFGEVREGGPEVEVLTVPDVLPRVRTTAIDDVLTVGGAPETVLGLQTDGLVASDRATVLAGEDGWTAGSGGAGGAGADGADIVTDGDQRRERAFGSNDEALSEVMGRDDTWRIDRTVHNFPTVAHPRQVTARYDGLSSLTASSAQAYADNFGPVVPQDGPYAALDGDPHTRWESSASTDPRRQWIRMRFTAPRPVRSVSILPVADDPAIIPIRRVEVRAGAQRVSADLSPSGARTDVALDGSTVSGVEVRIVDVGTASHQGRVALREVHVDGLTPTRSYQVPDVVGPTSSWWFSTTAERRACTVAVGLPDCEVLRIRGSEEPAGISRTFTTSAPATFRLRGLAVARSTREAADLLDPVARRRVGASSVYGDDPLVGPRFAYDGDDATAWRSSPEDPNPTLILEFARWHRITSIAVIPTVGGPAGAIVRMGEEARTVDLASGRATFDPLGGRRLEITFLKQAGAGTVTIPELSVAGVDLRRGYFPTTATGALCGLGPNVHLDGRPIRTRVVGTMGDVATGSPLRVESCGGPVSLEPGEHRLQVPPTVEFQVTSLAGENLAASTPAGSARSATVRRWGDTERVVDVGTGAATLISVPENFNPGWHATLDGHELRTIRVDGWQQGFVVPAGAAGSVHLEYRPQRTYRVLLPAGLTVSGGVLIAGLLLLLGGALPTGRRRRERARAAVATTGGAVGPVTSAGAVAAGVVVLGPLAGCGVLLGRITEVPHRAAALAGALVALSGVVDAVGGRAWFLTAGDAVAALAVGLAAGLALRPGPARGPEHPDCPAEEDA